MGIRINRFAERLFTLKYKYSTRSDSIRFSDLTKDLNGCLICMPSKLELIKPASEILPELAETFNNRDIKILLTSNVDPQSHEIIKRFVVIRPLTHDLDAFSLPKRKFLDGLAAGGLAVAIDMDTTPNFFNAVVALRAGAVVRTTFDKGVGLPYYNLILGIPSSEAAPRVSYRAMADILGNFRR